MPIGSPYSIPIETCQGTIQITNCGTCGPNQLTTETVVAIAISVFLLALCIFIICIIVAYVWANHKTREEESGGQLITQHSVIQLQEMKPNQQDFSALKRRTPITRGSN
jgi:cbb3-type cytochrome oxidase subunit 3